MDGEEATETSALLAKPTAVSPDLGLAPNSLPPSETVITADQNGNLKPAEDGESQRGGENRAYHYQGLPDVKAKLCYIVPAVGIGVWHSSLSREQTV